MRCCVLRRSAVVRADRHDMTITSLTLTLIVAAVVAAVFGFIMLMVDT